MLSLHDRSICGKILSEVRDGIAGDLHGGGRPGAAGGKLREHTGGVIHKIGVEAGGFDLLLGQIPGQLMDQRADHLQMPQFLRADRGSPRATSTKNPCAARVTGRKREQKRECAKCRLASFL